MIKDNVLMALGGIVFGLAWLANHTLSAVSSDYLIRNIDSFIPITLSVAVFGLLFSKLRYAELPLFRAVIKACLACFLFYLVTAYRFPASTIPETHGALASYITYIEPLFMLFGVLGFFRPSLALALILYYQMKRTLISASLGFEIMPLDWIIVTDICIFILLAWLFLAVVKWGISCMSVKSMPRLSDDDFTCILTYMCLLGICGHMGNYFYAGLRKGMLGEHFFSWALENQTQYLMLFSREVGILPLLYNDDWISIVYRAFDAILPFANVFVFVTQLAAVVAVANRRLLIIITLLYDIFHLTVFVTTGIFFWKFIILNLSIVYGLQKMSGYVGRRGKILLVTMVVFSPLFFKVNIFAWLDSRTINHSYFVAVTDDGDEYPVPSNFFLEMNIELVQLKFATPYRGHFKELDLVNVINDWDTMKKANRCELDVADSSGVSESFADKNYTEIIQHHHQYMMRHLDDNGHINPYVYPHHFFNNPSQFSKFNTLDLRHVVAYKFYVESECLYFRDNKFDKEVKLTGSYTIPVGGR